MESITPRGKHITLGKRAEYCRIFYLIQFNLPMFKVIFGGYLNIMGF